LVWRIRTPGGTIGVCAPFYLRINHFYKGTKMKKLIMPLCATAVLGLAACQSAPETLPPGQYSHTHKSTNSAGTATEKQVETNVYVDEHGNKKATQKTTTSTDPKGLFNKSTSTSTKTYD
jgi:hypothetical protein